MEIVFTLAILVCFAIGFFLLRKGLEDIRHGVGARTWPKAPAQLKRCVLEHHVTSRGTFYKVRVAYEYHIAGKQHQGDNIAVGYIGNSAHDVHAALYERLLGMQPFVIRYHPVKPEVSTILPSENALVYGTFVLGLWWSAFATLFLLLVLAFSGHGVHILVWVNQLMDSLMGR